MHKFILGLHLVRSEYSIPRQVLRLSSGSLHGSCCHLDRCLDMAICALDAAMVIVHSFVCLLAACGMASVWITEGTHEIIEDTLLAIRPYFIGKALKAAW